MPTQPGFFRLHCHFGEKSGHIMVETTVGGSCPLAGLLQHAIPGFTHGVLRARELIEMLKATRLQIFNHIMAVEAFNHIMAVCATLWLKSQISGSLRTVSRSPRSGAATCSP